MYLYKYQQIKKIYIFSLKEKILCKGHKKIKLNSMFNITYITSLFIHLLHYMHFY